MARYKERLQAQSLRRRGMSIGDIARRLKVSKSNVSLWCREITLTPKQIKVIYENGVAAGHKGRMIGSEANRQKRLSRINHHTVQGLKDISTLSRRDLLIAGTALYWCEGAKSLRTHGCMFINSNPTMVVLFKRFANVVLGVDDRDIHCTVQINRIHQPRIDKVLRFWSHLLKLPRSSFGNPYYVDVMQHKVYENYDTYYGILRLRILKSSEQKYRMLGLIDGLSKAKMSG